MKEAILRRKTTSWAGSERLLGNEAWNPTVLGFLMLQLEILISYVAGPNVRFRCDKRGVRTGVRWCLGWRSVDWSLEVWGLSVTWSSLRWFQLVAVRTKELNLFSYKWPQDSLRLRRFWSFEGDIFRGSMSPDRTRFQSFSFRSISMPGSKTDFCLWARCIRTRTDLCLGTRCVRTNSADLYLGTRCVRTKTDLCLGTRCVRTNRADLCSGTRCVRTNRADLCSGTRCVRTNRADLCLGTRCVRTNRADLCLGTRCVRKRRGLWLPGPATCWVKRYSPADQCFAHMLRIRAVSVSMRNWILLR